jgi:hypothetical protein
VLRPVADQCNFQILKHNSPVCIPRGRTALPFHTHSARHWRCGCAFTPTPPAPEGARLYPRFDPGGFNVFRHYGGLVWDQKNQLIVKMCPGKVCRVWGVGLGPEKSINSENVPWEGVPRSGVPN